MQRCFSKAEELEKEGNYKGAWSALPKASEYPDYAETIRTKQDEYERHFAHNLFSEEKRLPQPLIHSHDYRNLYSNLTTW